MSSIISASNSNPHSYILGSSISYGNYIDTSAPVYTSLKELLVKQIKEELEVVLLYEITKEDSILITNLKHENENIRKFCKEKLGIKDE